MSQQFTTVHTYRAPLTSPHSGLRLFAGTPATGYAVDTFATATAQQGARVYRPACLNAAVLWLDVPSQAQASTHLMLAPQALRELAGRLLDAAQDIEQNPAASLAKGREFTAPQRLLEAA
jgi:hypothetical protein